MSAELHLVVRVGTAEYAVPAAEVVQLDAYEHVTPVPNARAGVAGVVQVRGRVLPVLDVRVRVGIDAVEPTADTRLVVVRVGPRVVALRVDLARELLRLGADQLEAPPPLVASGSGGMVRGVARLPGRTLLVLDLEKLIGQEQEQVDGQ